jgi:NADP-dependent aldehyde dehydrogenase
MGVGQFCTNPAIVLGLKGTELKQFVSNAAAHATKVAPQSMLHRGICEAYDAGTAVWQTIDGIDLAAESETRVNHEATQAACRIFTTTLDVLEANEELRREVFGPCSIITECSTLEDMLRFANSLEGQLSAMIQGTDQDLIDFAPLIRVLEKKVGRLIFNGFATGIEVCPSMHHGGPYPASSHSHFTSIGTASIYRWTRPVCYQGFPDAALPEALRGKNSRGSMRTVDGTLTRDDA